MLLRAAARASARASTRRMLSTTQFETLASPAPGSQFHLAFPVRARAARMRRRDSALTLLRARALALAPQVHDLDAAKDFYGGVLGCVEGRSSTKWQDYSLHGHQIVAHW